MSGFISNVFDQAITLKAIDQVKNRYKREAHEINQLSLKSYVSEENKFALQDMSTESAPIIASLEEAALKVQEGEFTIDDLPNVSSKVHTEVKMAAIQIIAKIISTQPAQIIEMTEPE